MISSQMSSDDINTELYILNEKNTLITSDYIESILAKYGVKHKVKDIEVYRMAMVHKSYLLKDEEYWKTQRSKNTNVDLDPIEDPSLAIPLQNNSYERLEFLGDSVIHNILAEYFYKRYENENEGFMTRIRTKIENGDTLAHLCKTICLDKYILLSRYIEKNNGRENNKSILEDAFEAFIGALKLDGCQEYCDKFLIKLIEDEIDLAQILHMENNFKDLLLQYFHQRKWQDPQYDVFDISGPDNKKNFTMYVKMKKTARDDGNIVGMGVGQSKKKGEQEAAKQALIYFGEIKDDDSDSDTFIELEDNCDSSSDL